MTYSYNDLTGHARAIQKILKRSEEQEYSSKLIYTLNKNLRIIEQEIQLIEEQLKDMPEGWNDYQRKIQELAVQHGGEVKQNVHGSYIDTSGENFDLDKFNAESKKLAKENKDLINEAESVTQYNKETKAEALAEVTWKPIKLDYFPENIKAADMPFELIDLIEE